MQFFRDNRQEIAVLLEQACSPTQVSHCDRLYRTWKTWNVEKSLDLRVAGEAARAAAIELTIMAFRNSDCRTA